MNTADAELEWHRKRLARARAERALQRLTGDGDREVERLDVALAELEERRARDAVNRATVKAGLSGLVTQTTQPGEFVAPNGQPVVVMVDDGGGYLDLEGDQFDLNSLAAGVPCVAVFEDALRDAIVECRIASGPQVRRARQALGQGATLSARAVFVRPTTQIQPGMVARVEVEVARRTDILTIPISAVVRHRGRDVVIVRGPSGPERREIVRGLSDDWLVEILKGVAENETVLVGNSEDLLRLGEGVR